MTFFDFKNSATPVYILDEKLLTNNLQLLNYVQETSGAKVILALKGFAMFRTFDLVKQYLSGTTASSLHEAKLGSEELGKEVHAYCPAYVSSDFEKMMSACNHFTFNSLSEWERYKPQIQNSANAISCGLRINPEFSEVSTNLYNPCRLGSRLGITADLLGNSLPKGIEGLHFHTLCESSAESLEKTLAIVEQKFGHLLAAAKWLNMGGGHAITRKGYNVELLIRLITTISERYELEIILEPGSAVAWETGYLLASVLDIVENNGMKTAMLDTSFATHLPDCLEMPYRPKVWGAIEESEHCYNLGGLTCLSGDFIENYCFRKPLQVGDKLIFDDMIHYTMVKNHTFNGIQLPNIGIWKDDKGFELVKSFGYEDYKSRLS